MGTLTLQQQVEQMMDKEVEVRFVDKSNSLFDYNTTKYIVVGCGLDFVILDYYDRRYVVPFTAIRSIRVVDKNEI
jgi:hypothetical protein